MKTLFLKIITISLLTITAFASEKSNDIIFNLKTHDNKTIELKITNQKWNFQGYKNKVILLDFFGTWCPPCKREIPHLNTIREEFKNKFEILALDIGNRDGSKNSSEKLSKFIKEYDIKYLVTSGQANNDIFMGLSSLNPMGSIPFMILFDSNGLFVKEYVGMVSEKQLRDDISKLIK